MIRLLDWLANAVVGNVCVGWVVYRRLLRTVAKLEPKHMAATPNLFPWKRFWVPLHGKIHLEQRGGFLSDPDDSFGKYLNPDVRATGQVVTSGPGLTVLCGEPAMGKTIALESYLAAAEIPAGQLIKLAFRAIPNDRVFERQTIDSAAWAIWRTGTGVMTLVVDGVDEGLQKIDGFVDYLSGLLGSEPVTRLRVILACRSAEWPAAEGAELAALWPVPVGDAVRPLVWELCPLRRGDVEIAANASGYDAGDFLEAIHRQHVASLANRPMTLRMLLREFKGGGKFSGTHRDLYLAHCRFLCSEVDQGRSGRLRQEDLEDQVYEAAQRIAALTLLSNRGAVFTGPAREAEVGDLTLDEIAGAPGKGKLTRAVVRAALRTPLFWPKSHGRVHFFHQTFAECLACAYLARLPFVQLRALLCSRDRYGEYVEPQLVELAAWIAAEKPELFQHLVDHDPEALLRSDTGRLPDQSKAALVRAVLDRAQAEQLFDGREDRRFYASLNHPGLTRILRPYIENRRLNLVVRRMAVQIGASCQRQDLLPVLLGRLKDKRDDVIHRYAAAALDDVTTKVTAKQLLPYASGKRTLRGGANTRFWLTRTLFKHGVWRLTDALPYLEDCLEEKRESASYVLSSYATAADAEGLLAKAAVWPGAFDSLNQYHPFVVQACKHGLARLDEPAVRTLFVRMWLRARRKHEELPRRKEEPTLHSVLSKNPVLRRAFLVEALRAPGRTDGDVYRLGEIVNVNEDFAWLLNTIPTVVEPRIRREMARLAASIYKFELHASDLALLLRRMTEVPEVGDVFEWLRAWQLDEERAIKAKAQHIERLGWEKRMQERQKPRADDKDVWQAAYAGLAKRTADSWAVAAHNLFYGKAEDSDAGADIERHDLETAPGWKHFGPAEHAEIREAARHFLLHERSDPYLRKGRLTDFAVYAFRALFLLRAEIEKRADLKAAVQRHWVPVLLLEYFRIEDGLATTIPMAYRLAPGQVYRKLDQILLTRFKKEGYVFELRHFTPCWNRHFTRRLLAFCKKRKLPADFSEAVFRFLADVDRTAALAFGLQQVKVQKKAKDKVRIGALLFSHGLFETWDDFWPILKGRPALARSIVLSVAHSRSGEEKWGDKADTAPKLAQLYVYVRKLIPPNKDEPTPGGIYTPTFRMQAAQFRDELPRKLAAMGTEEACRLLEEIANRLPPGERIWIRWVLRDGIIGMRRRAWIAPGAGVVTAVVANSESRLLRNNDDLLAVVVESLSRLEEHLQRRSNSPIDEYWRLRKVGKQAFFAPLAEVPVAKKIASWLEHDFDKRKGITIQREVSVQWNKRTDLEVRAVAVDDRGAVPLEVTVEVKGCWHREVMKGLVAQLQDGYLRKSGRTHGVYLILWTQCASWNDPADSRRNKVPAKTLAQARAVLAKIGPLRADGVAYRIEPVLLDLTL